MRSASRLRNRSRACGPSRKPDHSSRASARPSASMIFCPPTNTCTASFCSPPICIFSGISWRVNGKSASVCVVSAVVAFRSCHANGKHAHCRVKEGCACARPIGRARLMRGDDLCNRLIFQIDHRMHLHGLNSARCNMPALFIRQMARAVLVCKAESLEFPRFGKNFVDPREDRVEQKLPLIEEPPDKSLQCTAQRAFKYSPERADFLFDPAPCAYNHFTGPSSDAYNHFTAQVPMAFTFFQITSQLRQSQRPSVTAITTQPMIGIARSPIIRMRPIQVNAGIMKRPSTPPNTPRSLPNTPRSLPNTPENT